MTTLAEPLLKRIGWYLNFALEILQALPYTSDKHK
jgi:hypothetical protein